MVLCVSKVTSGQRIRFRRSRKQNMAVTEENGLLALKNEFLSQAKVTLTNIDPNRLCCGSLDVP